MANSTKTNLYDKETITCIVDGLQKAGRFHESSRFTQADEKLTGIEAELKRKLKAVQHGRKKLTSYRKSYDSYLHVVVQSHCQTNETPPIKTNGKSLKAWKKFSASKLEAAIKKHGYWLPKPNGKGYIGLAAWLKAEPNNSLACALNSLRARCSQLNDQARKDLINLRKEEQRIKAEQEKVDKLAAAAEKAKKAAEKKAAEEKAKADAAAKKAAAAKTKKEKATAEKKAAEAKAAAEKAAMEKEAAARKAAEAAKVVKKAKSKAKSKTEPKSKPKKGTLSKMVEKTIEEPKAKLRKKTKTETASMVDIAEKILNLKTEQQIELFAILLRRTETRASLQKALYDYKQEVGL